MAETQAARPESLELTRAAMALASDRARLVPEHLVPEQPVAHPARSPPGRIVTFP
jgi:hypothetical protein